MLRTVISLEEADSSGASNNDVEMSNEGNITITNDQRYLEVLGQPILFHCDAGKISIAEKIHDVLQVKCDEEESTKIFNECYCFFFKINLTKEACQQCKIYNSRKRWSATVIVKQVTEAEMIQEKAPHCKSIVAIENQQLLCVEVAVEGERKKRNSIVKRE